MVGKIGRNDSCPCGSGKKYKKCCMSAAGVSAGIADFAWYELRKTEGRVIDNHLEPYAMNELSKNLLNHALEDFLPGELPEEIDTDIFFHNFFIPWFLFNWIPFEKFDNNNYDGSKTIAQNYLVTHEQELNSKERKFINQMSKTYYSFYWILEVELDRRLVVKDMLLGTVDTIKEKMGTKTLKRGDIVFSRILTSEDQSIFVGMAPFNVPPRYNRNVIDFKNWLIEKNNGKKLTASKLRESFSLVTFDCFFNIICNAYKNPFPILQNTDGELLQISKSYFEINVMPKEVLQKLLPLTLSEDADEFLQDAVRDKKSGKLTEIKIPWLKKGNRENKSWDNTVLGHILIKNDNLILETNSDERFNKGKELLNSLLGKAIKFKQRHIESIEQAINKKSGQNKNKKPKENLMELPEVQKHMALMVKSHWGNWFDEPIPALDNKTPREAAKTKKGKGLLEALFLEYERYDADRRENDPFKADISYLKKELSMV